MCNQHTTISVIDPANRTGKIELDMSLVSETLGLRQYTRRTKSKKTQFSLCMLFQRGKCKAGSRCHQIHADKAHVNALRQQASAGSTCCCKHGDLRSQEADFANKLPSKFSLAVSETHHRVLPATLLARTLALEKLLDQRSASKAALEIDIKQICRLHGQSRCLFGRDCKRFHVCREAMNTLAAVTTTDIVEDDQTFVFSFPSLSTTHSEFSDTSSSCDSSLGPDAHSSEEEDAAFSPVKKTPPRPFVNFRAHLFGVALD